MGYDKCLCHLFIVVYSLCVADVVVRRRAHQLTPQFVALGFISRLLSCR